MSDPCANFRGACWECGTRQATHHNVVNPQTDRHECYCQRCLDYLNLKPAPQSLSDEEFVRAWLLGYAWLGDDKSQAREVDCIMAQDGWRHLSGVAEHFAGMAEEPGPKAVSDATGFALSALYECHEGPHLPECPNA